MADYTYTVRTSKEAQEIIDRHDHGDGNEWDGGPLGVDTPDTMLCRVETRDGIVDLYCETPEDVERIWNELF